MTTGRVDRKVALITGAASGIGAAVGRLLAREGAHVVLADLDLEGAQTTLSHIDRPIGETCAISLDVAVEDEWRASMELVRKKFGRLDILVNCAGISVPPSPPSETAFDQWRQVMAVNLDGVFLGTKHALLAMEAGNPVSGSIVNISSVMGIVALPGVAAYNASKGGVRLYTKSVALSCAERGLAIRVNSVHPGFIDTPMIRRSMARFSDPDAAQRHYGALQPVGRLGTPEDVAFGVLYLASDESKFVTGAELVIDGGYTAR
jgi:3(or 17)beta-hydroxysteroid dehydrogenase